MVSLHRGRFIIVHMYLSFPIDPQYYHFLAILWALSPHFSEATMMKFGVRVHIKDSLHKPNVA